MNKELDLSAYEKTGTLFVHPDLKHTTLGAVIKRARVEKALNLRELGKQVGCSHVFLSKVESEQKFPSDELLAKIQRALGILRIVISGDKCYFESDSLADLVHPELIWFGLSTSQRKTAGLILSTLRRSGQPPTIRTPSPVETKQGVRAVFELVGADGEPFNISITDGNK